MTEWQIPDVPNWLNWLAVSCGIASAAAAIVFGAWKRWLADKWARRSRKAARKQAEALVRAAVHSAWLRTSANGFIAFVAIETTKILVLMMIVVFFGAFFVIVEITTQVYKPLIASGLNFDETMYNPSNFSSSIFRIFFALLFIVASLICTIRTSSFLDELKKIANPEGNTENMTERALALLTKFETSPERAPQMIDEWRSSETDRLSVSGSNWFL